MYFATPFCSDLARGFPNISIDTNDVITPGITLTEAYVVIATFGILVLLLSYGFVLTRERFYKDQVHNILSNYTIRIFK